MLLFAAIMAGRAVFVSLFAESVPFWDQWDAEGAGLLKPWLEGSLGWADLFAAHNEHRIVFTRLISLALFEANEGQWDNMVSAYANTAVYAAIATLFYLSLRPGLGSRLARATLFLALLVLGWAPYAHENTLVGFQSQFYLMTGFALAAIACAARLEDSPHLIPVLALVALLGCFTMASGLLGAIAAAGVLGLRWWAGRLRPRTFIAGTFLLAIVAVLALALVPHIDRHDALKAPGLVAWLRATVTSLSWPLPHGYRTAWIVWLPTAVAALRLLRTRQASATELVAFGLAGWVVLQAMAIGYSRGNGMLWPSSRYLDTLAIGLVANLWFALRMLEVARHAAPSWRSGPVLAAASMLSALLLAISHAFVVRTPNDVAQAASKLDSAICQTTNVRSYVNSGNRKSLCQQPLSIPYPDAAKLYSMLDDPSLRSILPASLRPPLDGSTKGRGTGFVPRQHDLFSPDVSSCDSTDCLATEGSWTTPTLRATRPYVQVLVDVHGGREGLSLASVTQARDGASHVADSPLPTDGSSRLHLATGRGSFHLSTSDASPTASLALHDVVDVGTLSMLAAETQDVVRRMFERNTSAERAARSIVESALTDPMANQPLQLGEGGKVAAAWRAPRSGQVEGLAVLVGNYGSQSDGDLVVTACSASGCISQRRALGASRDNAMFDIRLAQPWQVREGEPLTVELSTHGATQPVVIWTFPAAAASAIVAPASSPLPTGQAGRALRLSLTYVRP